MNFKLRTDLVYYFHCLGPYMPAKPGLFRKMDSEFPDYSFRVMNEHVFRMRHAITTGIRNKARTDTL